ncbi:hypothetical protein M5689_025310 [Euphorbia peplus]|nr:hypothetical protein M5689_025310 [Euphorbia peplus]
MTCDNSLPWRCTGYYGASDQALRESTWPLLRHLKSLSSLPWCVLDNFNDLLDPFEKKGIHPHPEHLFRGFREIVIDSF